MALTAVNWRSFDLRHEVIAPQRGSEAFARPDDGHR